jgi:hypothetical protein
MSLKWERHEAVRGVRYSANTPFGQIIVLDDGHHRTCSAHPVRGWYYFGNAESAEVVMQLAEGAYWTGVNQEHAK